jgi:hypothetical protein
MKNLWIVLCTEKNEYENVLFQMEEDDFRMGDDYYPVAKVNEQIKNFAITNEGTFFVEPEDWSVSLVPSPIMTRR